MKRLLIVSHHPSANTKQLAEAAQRGASHPDLDIEVVVKSPSETEPDDVLEADGLIIGTTENLAYMAGLTKDFFDRCYYSVIEEKQGLPIAVYIRAGHDGTGTMRALQPIFTGLRWQLAQPILILKGEWQQAFIEQVEELAMMLAAGLDAGIY